MPQPTSSMLCSGFNASFFKSSKFLAAPPVIKEERTVVAEVSETSREIFFKQFYYVLVCTYILYVRMGNKLPASVDNGTNKNSIAPVGEEELECRDDESTAPAAPTTTAAGGGGGDSAEESTQSSRTDEKTEEICQWWRTSADAEFYPSPTDSEEKTIFEDILVGGGEKIGLHELATDGRLEQGVVRLLERSRHYRIDELDRYIQK